MVWALCSACVLKLRERGCCHSFLIGVASVTLSFRQRLVTEHRHYFIRATASFGKTAARRFAQSVWLTSKR